uniref:cytochrome c oxidase subunit II n=1 Tax=Atkinsoniella aurantiaca TaxID=2930054 RepID=UPI0020007BAA|nr:cytochrome c oxidase subunit II [Atkinsoniella aurantiaca]UNZ12537.1 cytochrome c oxidase subunit II [Atkinsoniella aurantiaca]
MSSWMTLSFQDAVSPIMEQLIMFHDHTMMIIMMITVIVSYMMMTLFINKFINRLLLEGQMIELIWTIMPAFLLIFIALPSLRILYLLEEINNPLITIKAVGHQWFWSYEYSDFKKIEFDSYMKPTNELELNEFRLLDTDNRITLPYNINTRILVTSTDVIHSWTIPSLGIKIDASPGRINQGGIMMNRPGLYFGQCSEICGANHSFMPIVMESINLKSFISWLNKY